MFSRNKTEISRKTLRIRKSCEITDLGNDSHRCMRGDTCEAAKLFYGFLKSLSMRQLLNFHIIRIDEVPDTYYFNWITAGRPYAADVWDYDVYSEIGNYQKPVLLMHGDRDGVVPISYAERAAEVYPDVEYYVISGDGHGFYGDALDDAFSHIFEYLQKIDVL